MGTKLSVKELQSSVDALNSTSRKKKAIVTKDGYQSFKVVVKSKGIITTQRTVKGAENALAFVESIFDKNPVLYK